MFIKKQVNSKHHYLQVVIINLFNFTQEDREEIYYVSGVFNRF